MIEKSSGGEAVCRQNGTATGPDIHLYCRDSRIIVDTAAQGCESFL